MYMTVSSVPSCDNRIGFISQLVLKVLSVKYIYGKYWNKLKTIVKMARYDIYSYLKSIMRF